MNVSYTLTFSHHVVLVTCFGLLVHLIVTYGTKNEPFEQVLKGSGSFIFLIIPSLGFTKILVKLTQHQLQIGFKMLSWIWDIGMHQRLDIVPDEQVNLAANTQIYLFVRVSSKFIILQHMWRVPTVRKFSYCKNQSACSCRHCWCNCCHFYDGCYRFQVRMPKFTVCRDW